jgi:predicted DNA-binding transcriptional regulator YafY
LDGAAVDVPDAELDEHYASAYGIFGGKADKIAVLRFTPERARWVADEKWHPQQRGTWLDDGSYELRIPYRDSRELVMVVMRHAAAVAVVEPDELREELTRELRATLALYSGARSS